MFLKLSFTIINLSYIKHIDISPNKYNIYLDDIELKGSYNFLKLGELTTKNTKIEIDKKIHPNDYIKMTNWIDKLDWKT